MNIGIAGAGIVGRLLAWRLLRLGHKVTLFDNDIHGDKSAGWIAAAMLAPFSEVASCDPAIFRPGLAGIKQWRTWIAELAVEVNETIEFKVNGSVVVAHHSDHADLQWFFQRLQAISEVPKDHVHWITKEKIRALEPELNRFEQGIYLPQEGYVDNRQLYRALAKAIKNAGGELVDKTEISDVQCGLIWSNDKSWAFDLIIDCRGFGGKKSLRSFRGVRGEVLWVKAPEVNLTRPVRLMHPRYQIYISPRSDNHYVVGATEIESESIESVTVRSQLELLSALYSVHSGFAEAKVLEARAHCRPTFSDNLPKIVKAPGLLRVNGLYRHGYLLSPTLVNSTLAVIDNKPPLNPVGLHELGAAFKQSSAKTATKATTLTSTKTEIPS
ncbi:glycine oxidase ThiO [Sessilibacter corallicola]|uniref:D-amino-acid oxidase n=1 Tax=Sessilibacter corallicola TaxID=2904075 RepID=A0ABQ0A8P8_9GAMM|nr:glycine oxidase ThiO [Sessilibacter corallicola]MCE2030474.1 glycine oxidase ThiO [Sessilibacter corallicola]